MQNRFRELDIFSFLLSEGFISITDLVELATILDKIQVWPRKSILYVQISNLESDFVSCWFEFLYLIIVKYKQSIFKIF